MAKRSFLSFSSRPFVGYLLSFDFLHSARKMMLDPLRLVLLLLAGSFGGLYVVDAG